MFLLDTDTIIYLLKGHAHVARNIAGHPLESLKISVVTLMELYYGAHKSKRVGANLAKVRSLETRLDVLTLGVDVPEVFGIQKAHLESEGNRLDDFDLLMACTALCHNLTLVTNNIRHFSRIQGLRLDNWTQLPPVP